MKSDMGNFIFDTIIAMNAVRAAELTGDMSHLDKLKALKRPIDATAKIEPQVGVQSTEYRITGDLPNVQKAIAALFEQYHPAGYGTYVHSISYTNEGAQYVARVSRSNSCD